MIFRRELLLKLDGFDEALDTGKPLPGGGDLDIFYRVIRAGYPLVYEPACTVYHEHRRQLKALRSQYRSWGLGFMAYVSKWYLADSSLHFKLHYLIRWWFQYQFRQLRRSLRRRHPLPPDMIVAELIGGVIGLFGEYGRSKRRTAEIHKRYTSKKSARDVSHEDRSEGAV
jgi:hypothetical protein